MSFVLQGMMKKSAGSYYALKHYINSFLSLAYGNVFDTITRDTFKETKIPVPPLSEQHRIASILSQMDQTIEKEHKYKQKLESIKQGLMEDLLTGKVKVNYELGVRSYELGVVVR